MTVGDLRKKLEGVNDDTPVVVVNDFGYSESMPGSGVGVETRVMVDPERPWDLGKLSEPREVFVLPEVFLQWNTE